jgi:hypothetical protein
LKGTLLISANDECVFETRLKSTAHLDQEGNGCTVLLRPNLYRPHGTLRTRVQPPISKIVSLSVRDAKGTRLAVPQTGAYTFTLVADDGGRLFIGDKTVIDGWGASMPARPPWCFLGRSKDTSQGNRYRERRCTTSAKWTCATYIPFDKSADGSRVLATSALSSANAFETVRLPMSLHCR